MDVLKPLQSLGKKIAEEQDALLRVGSAQLASVRNRVFALALAQRRLVRTRAALGAGLALAAAVALTVGGSRWWQADPAPLSFRVGTGHGEHPVGSWIAADEGRPVPISFSDGTRLLLDEGSRVRVVDTSERGAHIVLESGRADVRVLPRQHATWQISTGPFVVHVTGTMFEVAWNPERDDFELTLQAGSVTISGCVFGDGRRVLPGETVRAFCKDRRLEVVSGADDPSSAPLVTRGDEPASPADDVPSEIAAKPKAPPPARAARTDSSWRSLARRGDYSAAFAAADALGFEAECEAAGPEDLVLLGDIARFSGRGERASYAFNKLRQRFPGSGAAALAAFSLARVAFDQRGDYASAARWFSTYLREQPSGKFAREALGRLMEALSRSGDGAGARRSAQRYLATYPEGPHAALAQKLVSEKSR
ncbi:MAG TPA: FecR domain-containing protein [Polyangiaceae bacterium]|nr:FecR domain-containing protein [Polyangiaceae bacterium]